MTTNTIDGTLTTQEMFTEEARKWASVVTTKLRANAAKFKHGKENKRTYTAKKYNRKTGETKNATVYEKVLKNAINHKTRKDRDGNLDRISFNFPLHGIYRAFGVGRGQPASGSKKKQALKIRVKRTMSDWISQPIEQDVEKIANIAANYYGDKVLANVWGINYKK
jgi:hypothetical protein